jgi:hypothetical protein
MNVAPKPSNIATQVISRLWQAIGEWKKGLV